MIIDTTLNFEMDIDDLFSEMEDNIRDAAEEVCEGNSCGFITEDDLYSYNFVGEDEVTDLINDSVKHINYSTDVICDLKDMTDDVRADLVIAIENIHMQRIHIDRLILRVAALEDARLGARLGRLWARIKQIHWYSPFIGPRR